MGRLGRLPTSRDDAMPGVLNPGSGFGNAGTTFRRTTPRTFAPAELLHCILLTARARRRTQSCGVTFGLGSTQSRASAEHPNCIGPPVSLRGGDPTEFADDPEPDPCFEGVDVGRSQGFAESFFAYLLDRGE